MRALIASMTMVLVIFAGTPADVSLEVEQRIERIESGLMPFTTPADMLQPGAANADELKTLTERMAHYNVPGVSVAVINDGRIDWARAYGIIRAGGDTPVTGETLFEAASTSKLVVSAIALHLVEEGQIDLDADVNTRLTSWKVPENSLTQDRKVTLRLLLTHQAGLNRPDGGFSWEPGSAPTLIQTLNGEAPVQSEPAAIEYTPGSRWQYSNFGYLVIQQLIEDVVGQPFPQIAQQVIFDPLGMNSSTFATPLKDEPRANKAVSHDAEGIAHEPEMHPTAVANGGLVTTPADLALFTSELIQAYHGKSRRILSREMVAEMFHKQLDIDPAVLGVPLGEGLGVLLFGEGENFLFLHPGDNMPGASCWLMGCADSGQGIVVMTNGAMGNLLAMEIVAAVIMEYQWPTAANSDDRRDG